MKKVFSSTHEVTHIWAQQKQEEGRAGNVYFHGKSIFSYGSHFEMARFIRPDVVFITTRTYSVTTASHLSGVRSAVSHLTAFHVPTFDNHQDNARAYAADLSEDLYRISRKRTDPKYEIERYQAKAKEAAEYVAMFGKDIFAATKREIGKINAGAANPLTPAQMEKFKVRAAADRLANKAANDARRAAEAKRLAAAQVDLDGWAAGADSSRSFYDMPVRLRVKDGEIQTSKGAKVPLIEARKLWHALQDKKPIEGMNVGHYTVTGIRDGALVVGCHIIPLREVYKMAQALDWGTFQMEVA